MKSIKELEAIGAQLFDSDYYLYWRALKDVFGLINEIQIKDIYNWKEELKARISGT